MKILFLLLTLTLSISGLQAQTVLEDFEGDAADLSWEAVNGTLDGAVVNPEDSLANPSGWVGSYTKEGPRAFSLFRAVFDTPLDLGQNNRYSVQINAGAATELIVKLEGDGESLERRVNITTPGVWRAYTFDFFDARAFTTIDRITLFFDPGVAESSDTYLNKAPFTESSDVAAMTFGGVTGSPIALNDSRTITMKVWMLVEGRRRTKARATTGRSDRQ